MDLKDDWSNLAKPEEVESARLELSRLLESLHRAELCVTVLKGHAMEWERRMLEAETAKQQAKESNVDAMKALQKDCQRVLGKFAGKGSI